VPLPKPFLTCGQLAYRLSSEHGIDASTDQLRRMAQRGLIPATMHEGQIGLEPGRVPEIAEKITGLYRAAIPAVRPPASGKRRLRPNSQPPRPAA
jgi:hypothetical protein